jgi:hypothetical protein
MNFGFEMRAEQARKWEAAGRTLHAAVAGTKTRCETGTPPRLTGSGYLLALKTPFKAKTPGLRTKTGGNAAKSLAAAPGNMRRHETIRQEIIGHRLRGDLRGHGGWNAAGSRLSGRRFVGGHHGALALFDKPASKHGGGILFNPGVDEGSDLLAEIGGVTEAREFVALQGVAGSGQKKFPGRLSAIGGHRILRREGLWKNCGDRSTNGIVITSNNPVIPLWKFVQEEEKSQKACSGCAGDYEDPERTAWESDPEEEEETAEFPVPEETAEGKAGEEPHVE